MKALLPGSKSPHAGVAQWLRHAPDSVLAYQNHHPARMSAELQGFSSADQLAIVNVAVQVERLTRHPMLAEAAVSVACEGRQRSSTLAQPTSMRSTSTASWGKARASRAGVRGGHRRDGNRSLW